MKTSEAHRRAKEIYALVSAGAMTLDRARAMVEEMFRRAWPDPFVIGSDGRIIYPPEEEPMDHFEVGQRRSFTGQVMVNEFTITAIDSDTVTVLGDCCWDDRKQPMGARTNSHTHPLGEMSGTILMGFTDSIPNRPPACPVCFGSGGSACQHLDGSWFCGAVVMDSVKFQAGLEEFKKGLRAAWPPAAPSHAKHCGCLNCYRERRDGKFHGVKLGECRNMNERGIGRVTKIDAGAGTCILEFQSLSTGLEFPLAFVATMPLADGYETENGCARCGESDPSKRYGRWQNIGGSGYMWKDTALAAPHKTPAKPKCISCGQAEPLGRDDRCWECGLNVEAKIADKTTHGQTQHQRLINRELRDWAQTLRQPYTNVLSAGVGVVGGVWRLR